MAGFHVKFDVPPEEFLAHLTQAVYRAALKHGLKVPFIKVEMDIQNAIREVIRRDMFVADVCGMYTVCHEASRFDPWSKEAKEAYDENGSSD